MNTSKMDGLIGSQVDTKLSGKADWATWKFKLTVLLRETNLLGIIDGTTPPPVKEEIKQDYDKLAENDAKAQSIIIVFFNKLYRVKQPVESGINFIQFMNKKVNCLYILHNKKFFEVNYKKNEAMSEYLGRVDAILDKLKSLGADVNKSMAITKIISISAFHIGLGVYTSGAEEDGRADISIAG
ncbi:hypothetical protein PR048_033012 [Dryococelus australis]|uniref:Uncharacterized protein n=1 Tax=Dryococelus australis TaxID=614101 RepID=A0ABQ9G6Z0_9NEOP|nr:hypothetical protein PR048_033012 [Dryococelus australis]